MKEKFDFVLDGSNLGIHRLIKFATSPDLRLGISEQGSSRIAEARKIVDKAIETGEPVYGLTTGLGARVDERLSNEELDRFSLQTLRGRAHSLGEPLPVPVVRGAMIVRLNTLMHGTSGCSVELAGFLRDCINRRLTPVIGSIGSIGASDLCWGATMGLALAGEGKVLIADGSCQDSAQAIANAGLVPFQPGPKDGLVLANNACFSASLAAFAAAHCQNYMESTQMAAALTMEAMGANLSPVQSGIVNASGEQGQVHAARQLHMLLEGSRLHARENSKNIQDPLSIRNVIQVHGTALTAHNFARGIINAGLNASSDNPQVDFENARLVSCGAYYSSSLVLAVETLGRAFDQLVVTQLARMSKLLSERYSGLPRFLAPENASSNGFAPTMKVAESLVARVRLALVPVDRWPSVNADGFEDIQSNAPLAAQSLDSAMQDCCRLCALEMMMAAQALELGGHIKTIPPLLAEQYRLVRELSAPLDQDRPLGEEIEAVTLMIRNQRLRIPD